MAKKEVPDHILIPKHKKLSEKEKKSVLDSLKITINELPSIFKKDPAIAGMEVEEGDVIKIERDSPTAGSAVFFRGVINE